MDKVFITSFLLFVSTIGTGSGADIPATVVHKPLPEPVTSFGAAVLGDYLYVFSGHDGVEHGFGSDLLINHFRRIQFDDPNAEWEELAMHAPAQSVALVTDGQSIYRVGGLSFLNKGEGSETNFNSTSHFARYDVEQNSWTDLAPLPEPRSSLDAAVVGRKIFAAGGWNLQGSSASDAPWLENIVCYDLDDPDSGWKSIDGPGYLTRAVSTAAHNDKFYLFGGIQKTGFTQKVSIYDPVTGDWSSAPELPADGGMAGFATSSFATGGLLYVTGASGVVYRLSEDETRWDVANRLLFPRMFLRLLPAGEHRLIALGGTGSIGPTAVVESLVVDPTQTPAQKTVRWSVDFGGRAKHSQALSLDGGKLFAFGGNASRESHDFARDAFVDEAFVFDIGNRSVNALPALPYAVQSGTAIVNATTSEHKSIVVAGGMGPEDASSENPMRYLESVISYNPNSQQWDVLGQKLPATRAMLDAVTFKEAIWIFGGSGGGKSGLATDVLHWWGDQTAIAPLHQVQLPHPRRSFGGAMLDGKYYLVGGLGEGMQIEDQVDVFDFETRSFDSIAAPSIARVFPNLVAADGKLYLHGGFSNASGHFEPVSKLEVYDPQENRWSVVSELLADVQSSMTMLGFYDRLLFYGIDDQVDGRANFVLVDLQPTYHPADAENTNFVRGQRDEHLETAKMMIRKDINKDGKLSGQELGSRWISLVEQGDVDQDGLLTVSELAAVLQHRAEAELE